MKRLIFIASLSTCVNAFAAGAAVPHVFVSGGAIVASEVNANYQNLADRIQTVSDTVSNTEKLLQFVGNSATSLDGSNGIRTMTELCQVTYAGSRMCSTEEYAKTITFPTMGSASSAWVRPSKVITASLSNDYEASDFFAGAGNTSVKGLNCSGWSNNNGGSSEDSGLVVNEKGAFGQSRCNATLPVSCCK